MITEAIEQSERRVRYLSFELEKADYGMGMPRDEDRVRTLKKALSAEELTLTALKLFDICAKAEGTS